jgi:hypothetical protein
MLIFLGAGASKPFGIPTMQELTDVVLKNLPEYTDEIKLIKDRLMAFGLTPDIEAILSCVDALSDPSKGVKDAGPFAAYISRHTKEELSKLPINHFKTLAELVREKVRHSCFLPEEEEELKKLTRVYDCLLNNLQIEVGHSLGVFTTNYDYCFESYCTENGIDFSDGFKEKKVP